MSWDENMDLRQTQTAMTRSQSQGSYGAGTGRDVGWEHHIPIKAKIHPGKRITYNVSQVQPGDRARNTTEDEVTDNSGPGYTQED